MQIFPAADSRLDDRLLSISHDMDRFEGYAPGHGERVAAVSDAVGQLFNLSPHDRLYLRQAALIHDVGEKLMDCEYISANRILTVPERLDMQRHPVIGEQEAARLGLPRGVQLLVRWHHEWWNGLGYPDCLEGEQIPLAARVLRAADTFVSLTDNRPYRAALSSDEARKYLAEWAGIEFDPRIVKAVLSLESVPEMRTASIQ